MAKVQQVKTPEDLAEEEHKAEQVVEEQAKKVEAEKPPKTKTEGAYIEFEQSVLMEPLSLMEELLVEIELTLDEEGLKGNCMDLANVAMINLDLKSAAFKDINGKAKVGIKLKMLKDILKRAKADEHVRINFTNPIEVIIASKFNKVFTLPQIDIDVKGGKLPELKHTSVFEIETAVIKEAIGDCGKVADSISFEIKNEKLIVHAQGDLSGYRGEVADLKGMGDCKSKFAREYLVKMVKALSKEFTMSLGDDYPVMFKYELEQGSSISAILAPRIESE